MFQILNLNWKNTNKNLNLNMSLLKKNKTHWKNYKTRKMTCHWRKKEWTNVEIDWIKIDSLYFDNYDAFRHLLESPNYQMTFFLFSDHVKVF
eukprot:UN02240